jgi:hypothetical protein
MSRANQICLVNVDGVDINSIDGLNSETTVAKPISSLPPKSIAKHIIRVIKK